MARGAFGEDDDLTFFNRPMFGGGGGADAMRFLGGFGQQGALPSAGGSDQLGQFGIPRQPLWWQPSYTPTNYRGPTSPFSGMPWANEPGAQALWGQVQRQEGVPPGVQTPTMPQGIDPSQIPGFDLYAGSRRRPPYAGSFDPVYSIGGNQGLFWEPGTLPGGMGAGTSSRFAPGGWQRETLLKGQPDIMGQFLGGGEVGPGVFTGVSLAAGAAGLAGALGAGGAGAAGEAGLGMSGGYLGSGVSSGYGAGMVGAGEAGAAASGAAAGGATPSYWDRLLGYVKEHPFAAATKGLSGANTVYGLARQVMGNPAATGQGSSLNPSALVGSQTPGSQAPGAGARGTLADIQAAGLGGASPFYIAQMLGWDPSSGMTAEEFVRQARQNANA